MTARFTAAQRRYLAGQRLARLATVDASGQVQNNPVTFFVRTDDTVDIGGMRMAQTKKFRNVEAGSSVALVIDDLKSTDPWTPRMLEIRGRAEAVRDTEPPAPGFSRDLIRIHPERILSFGLD